ncbi:MAG TPA: hypothetical protein VFG21_01215 [Xanthomonadaceae bacterium]|nr:hypothetical protein [Xanthomonadaceae bacterium]
MKAVDAGRAAGRRTGSAIAVVVVAAIVAFGAQWTPARTPVSDMTPALWAEDIGWLQRHLDRKYPRVAQAVDPASLDGEFAGLVSLLPELSNLRVVMELARIVALLGDGHTSVQLHDPPLALPRLPLSLYFYGEELRVNFADRSLEHLVGARVDAIAGYAIPDLAARLTPYIAGDNAHEVAHALPMLLATPAVLEALELAPSAERLTLDLTRLDGVRDAVSVAPLPPGRSIERVFARPDGDDAPLYVRHADRHYWFEPIARNRAVYVKLNVVNDQRSEPSIRSTAADIQRLVVEQTWQRMIFDLRHNTGGNFHRADPLVRVAREFAESDPGRQVFVLVSRHTYSAAMVTAMRLKAEAGAAIVGEVPRGRPNFTYNKETVNLPQSGIAVDYTDEFRTVVEQFGHGPTIALDLEVAQTFDDYRMGLDPVLEAVLVAQPVSQLAPRTVN